MEVRSLTMYAPKSNLNTASKKNVSFGDDCGYTPDWYKPTNAMTDMRNKGYIIQGYDSRDAFERFYDDVSKELAVRAKQPDAVWFSEYQKNPAYQDNRAIKRTVHNWNFSREDVTGLLSRFWDRNKNNPFNDTKGAVTNFLTNSEGMKKPNFFQMFLPKFTPYLERDSLLTDVVKLFLKDGRHRLR